MRRVWSLLTQVKQSGGNARGLEVIVGNHDESVRLWTASSR
jgi:hypothetical protein